MDPKILKKIISSLKEFDCDIIYIFGSYASGETNQDSDIDIAFLSWKKYSKYDIFIKAQEISSLVHKEIDLVHLNDSTTVFQNQVVKNGIIIFEKDILERQKFEVLVLKKYIELNELRKDLFDDYYNNLTEFIKKR
ncbi:MAG: type VII toxin-antitoxin system MntA family adenylyltransferase antitoxin [Cetobacterium sp.]